MRVRASRTSSSLNGLMTAMTSFMVFLPDRVFGWRLIYSENRSPSFTKLGSAFSGSRAGTTKALPAVAGGAHSPSVSTAGPKIKRHYWRVPRHSSHEAAFYDCFAVLFALGRCDEAEVQDQAREPGARLPGGQAGLDARVIQQGEQRAIVIRQVADHAFLVERGPWIALVVARQAEGVQQLVIGAVEEDVVAFVDDDEGDRAHDAAVGARFHAGHALRIGARDEGLGDLGAERGPQRRGEIFFVDQTHLDIGGSLALRDAQVQVGDLLRVFIDYTLHRRRAIDAAAGDHGGADRMIEAADAAWHCADAQIGTECEREKSAHEFGGGETRVLRRRALERAGRRRLLAGSGKRSRQHSNHKNKCSERSLHVDFAWRMIPK